ncbi:MAG: carbohydrate-binding protein, partial [Chitinispirillaceae bacterium]|nr:carbohydrate-binding protein [Chitinispirillaceae bacterium]
MKRILSALITGVVLFAGCGPNGPEDLAVYDEDELRAAVALHYEAENASLSGGAARNTNHSGYSGTGFVDGYYYSSTAMVTFTVTVPVAGSYNLTLHYSAGNGTSTNTGLYVNGTKIKNITCNTTYNWELWADVMEMVTLRAGDNTIAWKAESRSGRCINLDYIAVTGGEGTPTYTITAEAGANGSITPDGEVTVNAGAAQNFSVCPDEAYQVGNVTVDGVSRGAVTSYSFSNVTADHTIAVTFIPLQSGGSYEAENATLSGSAARNTNHAGYSGTGFVDGFYYSTNALATFTVNVASAGSYTLTLRYSAGNGTSTNTGLYVNGTKIKNITCNSTGNWETWADQTEPVTLDAGANTIAYKAEARSGRCINLDKITLTAEGCAPLSIRQQPASVEVLCGSTDWVTFTVAVEGNPDCSYHWYAQVPGSTDSMDCAEIPRYFAGATTPQLTTVPDQPKNVWCIITDDCGRRVSTDHNVGFTFTELVITRQPESVTASCGSMDPVTFSVDVSGSARYLYHWYAQWPGSIDSIDCGPETRYYSGGTTAQLTTIPDNAKKVWCIITDDCGRRVSTDHGIGFSFNDMVITREPQSVTAPCGSMDPVTFSV